MARQRKGKPIHGWLVIDKAAGLTSAQVVGRVKRLTGAAKVGHAGTLDPLATGVLPIALGEATKTVPFVMDGAKAYAFTVAWGEARDTDDSEGAVTQASDHRPSREAIQAALPAFLGEQMQTPPVYSAIKVAGERAYDLARDGQAPVLEPRRVTIGRLALEAMPDADHACFQLDCGKGTYVRALARDLARALGTCGHVAAIRRTRSGPFREADAIPLEKLEALCQGPGLADYLRPPEAALDDIPALALTEPQAARLRNGQSIKVIDHDLLSRPEITLVRAHAAGRLVALADFHAGDLVPVRVFNI